MVLKDLLAPPQVSTLQIEAQRKATAKLIAADKAKAAAILLGALQKIQSNEPTLTTIKRVIK